MDKNFYNDETHYNAERAETDEQHENDEHGELLHMMTMMRYMNITRRSKY